MRIRYALYLGNPGNWKNRGQDEMIRFKFGFLVPAKPLKFRLPDSDDETLLEVALAKKETDQPVVIVRVQKLLPPTESRLVNPRVELVPNL